MKHKFQSYRLLLTQHSPDPFQYLFKEPHYDTDKSHGISLIIHVKFHKYNNQDRFTVIAGLLELQINPHNSFSGVTQATAAKK